MDKIVLKASLRENKGKEVCKKMRREGHIPAVVYKDGKDALSLQVENGELWHALHTEAGTNAIITLSVSDGEKPSQKTVILKDIQLDPISDKFVHVDFHEISLKEKLKVKVPIVAKGEAIGVKEEEGVLGQIMWDVEVECLPTAIPEHIDVNVEELKIGDSIYLKDIESPADVDVLGDPEQIVLSVHPPALEEEEPEVEAEEGELEPEVIKKGKAEEEGEEEEAAPEKAPEKAPEEGEKEG